MIDQFVNEPTFFGTLPLHAHEFRGNQPTTNLIMIGEGGGSYDDYNSDYGGWWDSSGGIDYTGSNSISDNLQNSAPPADTYIPTAALRPDVSHVSISFATQTADGRPSDVPVMANMVNILLDILIADTAVNDVNIYATTNGAHTANSDHYQGAAVDINSINGNSIGGTSEGRTLALGLEAQALADVNTRYVEGPGGNWARSAPGAQWVSSPSLPTSNSHVHISVFK